MRATAIRSAYRSSAVETATQRDLIVQLYEAAERLIVNAEQAMRDRRIEAAHDACQRAEAIFTELLSTLNFEAGGGIANQLRELYLFLIRSISTANLTKDPAPLQGLVRVIAPLREAWQAIPAEYANGPATAAAGHMFDLRT